MLRLLTNIDVSRFMPAPDARQATLVKRGRIVKASERRPEAVGWLSRRSPQTTNVERKAADLESAVVNGLISAADAYRVFGCSPTRGRPRKPGQEDFASWLRSRIIKLSDTEAQRSMLDEVRRLQDDRRISGPQRAARERSLNRRITECDPAYVAKLRGALEEIYATLLVAPGAGKRRQAECAAMRRQRHFAG